MLLEGVKKEKNWLRSQWNLTYPTGWNNICKYKKLIAICIFLFVCSLNCFSQVINTEYFPKDNEIDKQYEVDMQKWTTNYEWQVTIGKYMDLWKKQIYLEMERLISIIPKSESIIRENQKKWEEAFEND